MISVVFIEQSFGRRLVPAVRRRRDAGSGPRLVDTFAVPACCIRPHGRHVQKMAGRGGMRRLKDRACAPDPDPRQVFGITGGLESPGQVHDGVRALQYWDQFGCSIAIGEVQCMSIDIVVRSDTRWRSPDDTDEVV